MGPSIKEILFKWFHTIDKDGRHAHIWLKKTLKTLLHNQENFETESWYTALGLKSFSDDDPKMTFDLFMACSNLYHHAKF